MYAIYAISSLDTETLGCGQSFFPNMLSFLLFMRARLFMLFMLFVLFVLFMLFMQ